MIDIFYDMSFIFLISLYISISKYNHNENHLHIICLNSNPCKDLFCAHCPEGKIRCIDIKCQKYFFSVSNTLLKINENTNWPHYHCRQKYSTFSHDPRLFLKLFYHNLRDLSSLVIYIYLNCNEDIAFNNRTRKSQYSEGNVRL